MNGCVIFLSRAIFFIVTSAALYCDDLHFFWQVTEQWELDVYGNGFICTDREREKSNRVSVYLCISTLLRSFQGNWETRARWRVCEWACVRGFVPPQLPQIVMGLSGIGLEGEGYMRFVSLLLFLLGQS